jgi:hypothetical protein
VRERALRRLTTTLSPARADLSVPRSGDDGHGLRPHLLAPQEDPHLHHAGQHVSRKPTTAFGPSASCATIPVTSIWSRDLCSLSTTHSARGCHLCLRYVLSPMCLGRTEAGWRARRDSNSRPSDSKSAAFHAHRYPVISLASTLGAICDQTLRTLHSEARAVGYRCAYHALTRTADASHPNRCRQPELPQGKPYQIFWDDGLPGMLALIAPHWFGRFQST